MIRIFLITFLVLAPALRSRADSPFYFSDNSLILEGAYLDENSTPKQIDASKAILVGQTMTSKELVDVPGPGYRLWEISGPGKVHWEFTNGRRLNVNISQKTTDVVSFKGQSMWWDSKHINSVPLKFR